MFKDFYSPNSYIDNSYIQEKSYVFTTKVRILYKQNVADGRTDDGQSDT